MKLMTEVVGTSDDWPAIVTSSRVAAPAVIFVKQQRIHVVDHPRPAS
ncbi:hypothetical protein OG520_44100 (plasmid) [Streptomyces sp. NBC_00984]|nr:hypothetical protein OG520_44100 [Streptomyces sp. NBC_00984]